VFQHDDDGSEDRFAGLRKVRAVNAVLQPDDVRVKRLGETVAENSTNSRNSTALSRR